MLPLKNHETLRLYGNKQEFPAFAFKNSEIELKRVMPDNLEEGLSVRLLIRTTQSLSLTNDKKATHLVAS